MPMLAEETVPQAEPIQVQISAASELFWAIYMSQRSSHHGPVPSIPGLDAMGGRIAAFWGDGCRDFTEMMVLADRAGELFATDLTEFLGKIQATLADPSDPVLRSESAEDRQRVLQRLTRLRESPDLRTEYVKLLADCWEAIREPWQTEGVPLVEASARAWRQQVEKGATASELTAGPLGRLTEFQEMAERAAAEGRLVLSPGYFAGKYLVLDLESCLFVSSGVREMAPAALRAMSQDLAKRLKAIADPTRLAVLRELGVHEATVTDLAKRLGVSQPTMSAHMAVLRDAELVRSDRLGSRVAYSIDRDRLQKLLHAVEDLVC